MKHHTTMDSPAYSSALGKGEEYSRRGPNGRRAARRPRTSRDATSINADKRGPIDPRMPYLPPA